MLFECTECHDALDTDEMWCGECNPPSDKPTYKLKEIKMNIRPLHDRVVIRQDEIVEQTLSGIIIPTQAQEKQYRGTVVAVGPGAWDDKGQRLPLQVAVGDKVLYGRYAAQEVKLEGETLVIIKETEVFAVV